MMRWLVALVVSMFFLAGSSGDADAQAFKPRGKGTNKAKKPVFEKKEGAEPKKAATPKKGGKKKGSRAQSSARPDDMTPDPEAKKGKGKGNPEDADDYVLIEDDEE